MRLSPCMRACHHLCFYASSFHTFALPRSTVTVTVQILTPQIHGLAVPSPPKEGLAEALLDACALRCMARAFFFSARLQAAIYIPPDFGV